MRLASPLGTCSVSGGSALRPAGLLRVKRGMQPISPRASVTEFGEEVGPKMRRTTSLSSVLNTFIR